MVNRGHFLLWSLAGCGLVATELGCYLSTRSGDPTALLQAGGDSPARPVLERELGAVAVAAGQGHDGKYSYLIARRPWFWCADPGTLAGLQDPPYRYGRPLYPLVAGLGGLLPPRATLAGLVVVQIVAGGVLAAALAALARRSHIPTLPVLIGLANPGVYYSAVLLTSDLLALALVLAGLACRQSGRVKPSLGLFAAAALAKEYYALTPLALAGALVAERRWHVALVFAVVPLLPVAAWRFAVWSVLGPGEGTKNFTWPGVGVWTAAPDWKGPAIAVGCLAAFLVAAAAASVVRPAPLPIRAQCAAWVLLALTASGLVWDDPTNALRVVSPLWWFTIWCWCAKPPGATRGRA